MREICFLHGAPGLFPRFLLLLRHISYCGTIPIVAVTRVSPCMAASIVIAAACRFLPNRLEAIDARRLVRLTCQSDAVAEALLWVMVVKV